MARLCAAEVCTCPVDLEAESMTFCSELCADSATVTEDTPLTLCPCGHATCENRGDMDDMQRPLT